MLNTLTFAITLYCLSVLTLCSGVVEHLTPSTGCAPNRSFGLTISQPWAAGSQAHRQAACSRLQLPASMVNCISHCVCWHRPSGSISQQVTHAHTQDEQVEMRLRREELGSTRRGVELVERVVSVWVRGACETWETGGGAGSGRVPWDRWGRANDSRVEFVCEQLGGEVRGEERVSIV